MSFNVLIVDDSMSMRAVIRKIIVMSGFRMDKCLEAGNGREALDALAETVDRSARAEKYQQRSRATASRK